MTIQKPLSGLLADVAVDLDDIFRFPDGQLPSGFVETRIRREPLPAEVRDEGLDELARTAALQLWGLANAKIRKGVRLRLYADRRVVRLFDYVDYEIYDQGRRVRATFDDIRHGQFQAAVYVGSPLPNSGWTNNILIRALHEWREALRADLGTRAQRSSCNRYQDSIVKAIERWSLRIVQCVVARWIDLPRLRATLRNLMQIDPQTLRLTRRLGFGRGVSGGVTSLELDEVARWQDHLLEIEACAPALLDLFWIERKRWSTPNALASRLLDGSAYVTNPRDRSGSTGTQSGFGTSLSSSVFWPTGQKSIQDFQPTFEFLARCGRPWHSPSLIQGRTSSTRRCAGLAMRRLPLKPSRSTTRAGSSG